MADDSPSPRHTGSMRAGWGQEKFLFPTVEVPPSNFADVENQEGPEPSDVVAGAGNLSTGIDIGVVGTLRDDPDSIAEFPMQVRILDYATQAYARPSHSRAQSPSRVLRRPTSVDRYTGTLNRSPTVPGPFLRRGDNSIPRVGLHFASDSNVQIRVLKTKGLRFPASGLMIPLPKDMTGGPPGTNSRHYKDSTPCLFYDSVNERLIIFNVYNHYAASYVTTGQTQLLAAISYKQGVNTNTSSAENFWTLLGYSRQLWNDPTAVFQPGYEVVIRNETDPAYAAPMCAAVEFQGNVYVLVTDVEDYDPGVGNGVGCGGFYVTVFDPLNGTADAFRPIIGPVKPSRSFATRVVGISAAAQRNSCVVFTDNFINFQGDGIAANFKPSIQYARSTDMRGWGGAEDGRSQTYTLGSFVPVTLAEGNAKPIDIAIDIDPNSDTKGEGWAVTADHEILFTADGGETWQIEAEFDKRFDFHSVCIVRRDLIATTATPTYRAFAFTKDGIVFRRRLNPDDTEGESTPTWEICAAANPDSLTGFESLFRQIGTGDSATAVKARVLKMNIPSIPLRGIAIQDADNTRVWVVGPNGVFRYSGDNDPNHGGIGAKWSRPDHYAFRADSDLRDIQFINSTASRYRLAVGGKIHRHNGLYAQVGIVSHDFATAPTAVYAFDSGTLTDNDGVTNTDERPINSLFFNQNGRLFFGGEFGTLGYWDMSDLTADTNDSNSANWLAGNFHNILSDTITEITSVFEYNSTIGRVLLFTDNAGAMWRSVPYVADDTNNPWVRFLIDGSPVQRTIQTLNVAGSDEAETPDILMAITDNGIYRGDVFAAERRYPTVIALKDTGHYLAACVLTTQNLNTVEIWKSTDDGVSFHLTPHQPQNARWNNVAGTFGRPTLVQLPDGSVLLTLDSEGVDAAQKNFWSFDDGDTWIDNSDPSVPQPISAVSFANDATDDSDGFFHITGETSTTEGSRRRLTRSAIAYGGGPFYQAWQSADPDNRQAIFRTFQWITTTLSTLGSVASLVGITPAIVTPGVPLWTGLDDVRLVFSGNPAVADTWDIKLRYRYDVRNVGVESPSIFYRSRNEATTQMIWQRDNADVIAAIGDGVRWQVDGFALFGTNFPRCTIRIAAPDYSGSTFPSTASPVSSEFIEFAMDSIIEFGQIGSIAHSSVLVDNSRQWIPHQWKPSTRTYYVAVYANATPNTILQVAKILDNTENSLLLDTASVTGFANAYFIYGDRFFCDGTGGKMGDGTHQIMLPDIRGTDYQFTKFIQLEIPNQDTPAGYFTVGSFVFGTKTPLNVDIAPDGGSRRRFNRGFGWQGDASISEDVGLSGVASYEQFGRLRQTWTLQYQFIKWWDRDYFFTAMMDKPKRAFVILFDEANRHSLELVRLVDAPSYTNISGEYYDFDLNVVEVI